MTLRFKIFLYFILPPIICVGSLSLYNYKQELAKQEELSQQALIRNTQNANIVISRNSTIAITLLKASSEVLSDTLFGNRPESISYLGAILKGFNDFYTISLAYEINADGNDAISYNSLKELQATPDNLSEDFYDAYDFQKYNILENIDSWVNDTENGRFLFRLRKSGENINIEALNGIESREHYASVKSRFTHLGKEEVFVSDPSYENVNLYIEYIYPLIQDNKFIGELSFYKNLYYISNTLKSFAKVDGAEFFLITETGKVVANTLDMNISTASIDDLYLDAENKFNTSFLTYKNGKLSRDESIAVKTTFKSYNTLYRDILRIIARGDKPRDEIIKYTDPQSKEAYIINYTKLDDLNWSLVQIIPEKKLYDFRDQAKSSTISEIILSIICFIVACLAFSYYTRRLKRTRVSVENINNGKLHLQIPEIKQSKDESVMLINSISQLSTKISSIIKQSKVANTQLIDTAEKLTVASNDYEQSSKHFDAFIGEISNSLGQINDTSKTIKDSIEVLYQDLKQSALLAKEEKSLIENSFKTIDNLSETTLNLLSRVQLIKDRATNALSSLNQVSKIISQANLLSINTSIEAKKSNEKSAIFSKISKEISMIAKLTNDYAKEVSLIIRDLLESSFVAIEQSYKFNEEINSLKKDFEKIIPSIDNTSLSIDNSLPEVEKINDAMASQNLRKTQLKETIFLLENNSKQAKLIYRKFIDLRRELNFAVEQITHEISKFSSKY